MGRESELAILGLQAVDVNRPIGRLSRDKLIERVPGHALNVVRVLRDLPYHLSYNSVSLRIKIMLQERDQPFWALYIRAMLSMLPVMMNTPSGDQARS